MKEIVEDRPIIICLTPIKNESWILDRFLKSASLWADYIIIADQMSTDGSRDICKKYEKVILIDNNSETFNEPERQKLLINEARKIQGPRLLITLDADELFSPNYMTSAEWNTMVNVKQGTIFEFQLANLSSDLKTMWTADYFPWGYMDDGAEHEGQMIHSARIPLPLKNDRIRMNEIKVLHFQFTDTDRMKSKHRWYQCFEKINYPHKKKTSIFRMYHHMYEVDDKLVEIPEDWSILYAKLNIDITSVCRQQLLWWDELVLDYMDQYGAHFFAHLNIWEVNWCGIARKWERPNPEKYKDPRKKWEKIVNRWLIGTQKNRSNFWIRQIDKLIDLFY